MAVSETSRGERREKFRRLNRWAAPEKTKLSRVRGEGGERRAVKGEEETGEAARRAFEERERDKIWSGSLLSFSSFSCFFSLVAFPYSRAELVSNVSSSCDLYRS